tara:strand:+ start:27188 stop:27814 length:627 start_codon:yes stop_codon:yes gene_type:complete
MGVRVPPSAPEIFKESLLKKYFFLFIFPFLLFVSLPMIHAQEKQTFLKAFYPLDEPRFHCIDIPGHKTRVKTERPLVVHTCKEGIWHKDELFDSRAIEKNQLRMPEYDLCVQAESNQEGAKLVLKECKKTDLQLWEHKNYRLVLKQHPEKCITIRPEASRLTRGGRRLPSKHMARSLSLENCSEEIFHRQMWRFEEPQNRTGPVMPFK